MQTVETQAGRLPGTRNIPITAGEIDDGPVTGVTDSYSYHDLSCR